MAYFCGCVLYKRKKKKSQSGQVLKALFILFHNLLPHKQRSNQLFCNLIVQEICEVKVTSGSKIQGSVSLDMLFFSQSCRTGNTSCGKQVEVSVPHITALPTQTHTSSSKNMGTWKESQEHKITKIYPIYMLDKQCTFFPLFSPLFDKFLACSKSEVAGFYSDSILRFAESCVKIGSYLCHRILCQLPQ